MKLLTAMSQWLPHIIFIEIGIIILVGFFLIGIIAWRWFRKRRNSRKSSELFQIYQDLPSAESFLDDWTMTKPKGLGHQESDKLDEEIDGWKLEPVNIRQEEILSDSVCHTNNTHERLQPKLDITPEPPKTAPFEGEEIEKVLNTIIQVKRDLKKKSDEIYDLSKKLNKQQTVNKFAIKEKLMAIRKAELNKKELEQEIKNLEQDIKKLEEERNNAYKQVVKTENQSYFDAKEKIKSVSELIAKEKLMAMRKAELEKKALEQEIANLEEERDKAYEAIKENEINSFVNAKNKVAGIEEPNIKSPKNNINALRSAISKFKPAFNFNFFKQAKQNPKDEVPPKKEEIKFSNIDKIKTPASTPNTFTPPKEGRKTISITVPPELMS